MSVSCTLCLEDIFPGTVVVLYDCGHLVCGPCFTKLMSQNPPIPPNFFCSSCRAHNPAVLISYKKRFNSMWEDSSSMKNEFQVIDAAGTTPVLIPVKDVSFHVPTEPNLDVSALTRFPCLVTGCNHNDDNLSSATDHLHQTHKKHKICVLCLDDAVTNWSDMQLYTGNSLAEHRTEVHFRCNFCGDAWFYDSDKLYSHLEAKHFSCLLCAQVGSGASRWYKTSVDRELHYAQEHYICPHCKAPAKDDTLLLAHVKDVHNKGKPLKLNSLHAVVEGKERVQQQLAKHRLCFWEPSWAKSIGRADDVQPLREKRDQPEEPATGKKKKGKHQPQHHQPHHQTQPAPVSTSLHSLSTTTTSTSPATTTTTTSTTSTSPRPHTSTAAYPALPTNTNWAGARGQTLTLHHNSATINPTKKKKDKSNKPQSTPTRQATTPTQSKKQQKQPDDDWDKAILEATKKKEKSTKQQSIPTSQTHTQSNKQQSTPTSQTATHTQINKQQELQTEEDWDAAMQEAIRASEQTHEREQQQRLDQRRQIEEQLRAQQRKQAEASIRNTQTTDAPRTSPGQPQEDEESDIDEEEEDEEEEEEWPPTDQTQESKEEQCQDDEAEVLRLHREVEEELRLLEEKRKRKEQNYTEKQRAENKLAERRRLEQELWEEKQKQQEQDRLQEKTRMEEECRKEAARQEERRRAQEEARQEEQRRIQEKARQEEERRQEKARQEEQRRRQEKAKQEEERRLQEKARRDEEERQQQEKAKLKQQIGFCKNSAIVVSSDSEENDQRVIYAPPTITEVDGKVMVTWTCPSPWITSEEIPAERTLPLDFETALENATSPIEMTTPSATTQSESDSARPLNQHGKSQVETPKTNKHILSPSAAPPRKVMQPPSYKPPPSAKASTPVTPNTPNELDMWGVRDPPAEGWGKGWNSGNSEENYDWPSSPQRSSYQNSNAKNNKRNNNNNNNNNRSNNNNNNNTVGNMGNRNNNQNNNRTNHRNNRDTHGISAGAHQHKHGAFNMQLAGGEYYDTLIDPINKPRWTDQDTDGWGNKVGFRHPPNRPERGNTKNNLGDGTQGYGHSTNHNPNAVNRKRPEARAIETGVGKPITFKEKALIERQLPAGAREAFERRTINKDRTQTEDVWNAVVQLVREQGTQPFLTLFYQAVTAMVDKPPLNWWEQWDKILPPDIFKKVMSFHSARRK